MKIMPIMANKNDCLQKQQSKANTPSFNGCFSVRNMKSYKMSNYVTGKNILAVAIVDFLRDVEKKGLNVESSVLNVIKSFIKTGSKGEAILEFPKELDDYVLAQVLKTKQKYRGALIKANLGGQDYNLNWVG